MTRIAEYELRDQFRAAAMRMRILMITARLEFA
jgi:hypothetical protein